MVWFSRRLNSDLGFGFGLVFVSFEFRHRIWILVFPDLLRTWFLILDFSAGEGVLFPSLLIQRCNHLQPPHRARLPNFTFDVITGAAVDLRKNWMDF